MIGRYWEVLRMRTREYEIRWDEVRCFHIDFVLDSVCMCYWAGMGGQVLT